MKQGKKAKQCTFASLMDICHRKNSELEPKFQKYKGRVVLRGDIVKYDSGSYAVFTEQGSSASQMTAAKVTDVIARLPGCAGQAADAVSAYTQVKMEDATSLLQIPKSECPDFLDTSTKTRHGQNHGPAWKTQSFLMNEICIGHPSGRTIMGKAIWQIPIETWLGENSKLGMSVR